MPPLPADCREAIQWFVSNFGLYVGSVRGLFLSDVTEEHQASLEASIINLRSRGFAPLVVTGEMLTKQAEYLWDQASAKTSFGRPVASKLELDLSGSDLVIIQDILAPENFKQLWYFWSQIIYPRALSGKATLITTPISYDEFVRYGSACPDGEFGGRSITWEKLEWLTEATMVSLELFRQMREEGLPPMLKAEYLLWTALKDRGLPPIPQHVLGDYMLDLAIVEKEQRLNIECDGLAALGGYERQAEEAKRNLLLLTDGWQILRFTTGEILNNPGGCADVVEEVWRSGRKKQVMGRLLTGQTINPLPDLPGDDDLQHAAIIHGGGPAGVVGGAGTGKTTAIIQRVSYLISQGLSPESILVLSHSAETLKPVRAGLEAVLEKPANQRLQLYAWSDLGLRILKENLPAIKRKPPLKIEPNPQKLMQRILAKFKKELNPLTLELSADLDEFTIAAVISIYKANLISPKQVKDQAKDEIEELIAKVYQGYEDQLQRANRIDRDDMVSLAVQSLLDKPELRARYQSQYEFILVDEFQDATVAQDMLVRLIAAPQDNLFLVGDEDEAIYESKGASARLLSDISLRMPQARCYVLEHNWRSHPAIVDHARQLISGLTSRRIHKELVSAYAPAPAASAIIGPQQLASEKAEAEWVADEIQILVDSGRPLRDMAVLYRYHRYASILEEALSRRGVRCLASHPEAGLVPDEVEDMLAFLKLVADPDGPKAKEAFERVCQLRSREVDPKLSSTIASFAEANNLSFLKALEIYSEATADQSCKELEQLVRIIRTTHQENLPPAETISFLRRTQRLNEYYGSVSVPSGVNYEPLRKLTQLEEQARKFQTVKEFLKHHTQQKQQLGSGAGGADPGVNVLTLHEAKGLEFPVVFMVGLAEGLFPSESAGDIEEERRLCYLGFTRARDLLYLSFPGMFNDAVLQPSSFLVDARLMAAPAPPVISQPLQPASQAVPAQSVPPAMAAHGVPAAAPPVSYVQPSPPGGRLPPPPAMPARPPVTAAPAPRPVPTQPPPGPLPPERGTAPERPPAIPPAQVAPAAMVPLAVPAPRADARPLPEQVSRIQELAQPPESTSDRLAAGFPVNHDSSPMAQAAPPSPEVKPAEAGPPAQAQSLAPPAPEPGMARAQPGPVQYFDLDLPPQLPPANFAEVAAPGQAAGSLQPQCPHCFSRLEANARFCGECGFHLGTRIPACPLCASPLEPTAKFCGECGMRLAPNHLPPAAAQDFPLSPGGLPMPGRRPAPTQHGWLVKFLKFLESGPA